MSSHKRRQSVRLPGLQVLILAVVLAASACTAQPSPAAQQPAAQPAPPSEAAPPTAQETAAGALSPAPTRTYVPTPTSVPTIEPGPHEVLQTANIPYTSSLKLDVYAPAEPGPWPVVVVYHGGLGTTKEAMRRLSTAVASYGMVVFVPNWRPTLTEELERGAEDAACAVRFARAYAAEYGGNAARITGAGHSAGAMIAALMGLIGDEFSGDCLVEEGSGYLDGIAAIEGPYDMVEYSKTSSAYEKAPPEMWEKLSPMFYPARLPPREGVEFHIFISDLMRDPARADTHVFYNRLLEGGHSAALTIVPGIKHGSFASPLPETVSVIIEMARRQAALP